MKLLVIGKRGGILQWYEHVLAAATELNGVESTGFALNHNNAGERFALRWQRWLGRDWKAEMAARLAESLRRFRPDACVIVDRFYLAPQVNDLLSVARIPVHQWVGDRFDARLAGNHCVSRFWFTDSGLQKLARDTGIADSGWLPLAVNAGQYDVRLPWAERAPELLFVGAWSANRQRIIEQLELPMRVVGKGWHRLQSPWHQVHPYNVTQAQLVELYGRHRHVLNIINSDNIVSGLNMRCFEATAAGACLVTDHVIDLPRCFEPGTEVLAWRDVREIPALLAGGDMPAQGVAAAGMARTQRDHGYRQRLQAILGHTG